MSNIFLYMYIYYTFYHNIFILISKIISLFLTNIINEYIQQTCGSRSLRIWNTFLIFPATHYPCFNREPGTSS
jgi:hypothetical protein